MKGSQLFCPAEGKGPHEGSGYCHQYYFSSEIVAVLILVHPCNSLSGVIVDTDKDEDNSIFCFLLGAGVSD